MATANAQTITVGVNQLRQLVGQVSTQNAGDPTPCTDWDVSQLVDHIVHVTGNFAHAVRGEKVDWAAPAAPLEGDRAAAFTSEAEALVQAAARAPEGSLDMPCAELGVHTWDLATALGVTTGEFDPQLAEVGYAMLQANLTDDARGAAFAPAVPAPDGADAYTRLAAFAGRPV